MVETLAAFCVVEHLDVIEHVNTSLLPRGIDSALIRSRFRRWKKRSAIKKCDPKRHQTKKGNQYYFRMKAHIGVDADSGLVYSVVGTAANTAVVTQVDQLLRGEDTYVCGDADYTGVEKCPEHGGRKMTCVE